jgi:glycosyltransferase involved in cell wall biosynthesis
VRSYLFVLASSCQMYSGTGTAVFDWIRYCRDDFAFSILMDDLVRENLGLTAAFCKEVRIPLYISESYALPGCCDTGVRSIAHHFQNHDYDFIECVSWANAATNAAVLAAKPLHSRLIFTPHSQPIWTLPDHERYFMTSRVFAKMIHSADAVFIDTRGETALPEFSGASDATIHFIPLGVDITRFSQSGQHRPYYITCVCDCREPRKRLDLLFETFRFAHRLDPRLRLVLAGKGSDTICIPDEISLAVIRHGYVSRNQLVELYRDAGLFALLSDYEAFGLPIAEALCCGTPVLLNAQPALVGLFDGMPGVNWTDNSDIGTTAAKMVSLGSGNRPDGIAEAAFAKFAFSQTYGKKRAVVQSL